MNSRADLFTQTQMSKFSLLEVLMLCKLLSSPKALGVGAHPGKRERVVDSVILRIDKASQRT